MATCGHPEYESYDHGCENYDPATTWVFDDDPAGDGNACGDWDDERMARASYAALKGWFDLFPERRGNDLYLTGESYAGIATGVHFERVRGKIGRTS